MDLSIVITTYNRSSVLARLLSCLSCQTDLDFQVVVAIDGSTDDTEAALARMQVPFDLRWINTYCRGYGLAVARNQGIIAASGQAVALLDDDSFPGSGFVAAHKLSASSGVITGGPRNPADPQNERMAWKMRELGRLPSLTPMPIAHLRREWPNAYLIENNICLLRDDFIGMGLFSERLKRYGYIGQEFFARAEFLGLRYQYNPNAVVVHHGEFVGDNNFGIRRKQYETRISELIRPSLLTPRHYRAQVSWASAQAAGRDVSLPPFRLRAALAMPWRFFRLAMRATVRFVRKLAAH